MTNQQKTLSRYLKLIIGLLYLYLISYILLIPIIIFDPTYFINPTVANTAFSIAMNVLLAGLTAYTIYAFHKRIKLFKILVVLMIFLGYGINSFPVGLSVEDVSIASSIVLSAVFLTIETLAIVYVLVSKEIEQKFKK